MRELLKDAFGADQLVMLLVTCLVGVPSLSSSFLSPPPLPNSASPFLPIPFSLSSSSYSLFPLQLSFPLLFFFFPTPPFLCFDTRNVYTNKIIDKCNVNSLDLKL